MPVLKPFLEKISDANRLLYVSAGGPRIRAYMNTGPEAPPLSLIHI